MGLSEATKEYWDEGFDGSKHCESLNDVQKLQQDTEQCRTSLIRESGEESAFKVCLHFLTQRLDNMCQRTEVKDPGKLLYCKNRGVVICCFKDVKCETSENMNINISVRAKEFLTNTTGFLDYKVNVAGYKTCHRLDSLDASICAKDCKKQEEEMFAEQCRDTGGLFKCCIRRDRRFCDECRFCCTLPICVRSPGGEEGTDFDDYHLELHDQVHETFLAEELYFSHHHRFKTEDYYCLKPYSHKDPAKWKQYDMEEYRAAYTEDALDKVHTYKHDVRLNNFADPKVLKAFTKKEKKSLKAWKETYNMWMKRIPSFFDVDKGNSSAWES